MEKPKTVKIGGHTFKVMWPHKFLERNDTFGHCNHPMAEIRVGDVDAAGNEIAESAQVVTFIHELLHAIDISSGHKIFNSNEAAIEGISEGIYQVLVDNGWLKVGI